MWTWLVGCVFLASPDPAERAREASIPPQELPDGSRIVSAPAGVGALALLDGQILVSVPEALLTVPTDGGPTRVLASLPEDCWPQQIAISGGAPFVGCGSSVLRIAEQRAQVVLEGSLLHSVVAGHDGVYTCQGTRLVHIASDGRSHVTLAELGSVPSPNRGPATAACLGARIVPLDEPGSDEIFVFHVGRAWAVPRSGGAPRVLQPGPFLRQRLPGRWITQEGHPPEVAWTDGERSLLQTRTTAPCAVVEGDRLYTCVEASEQLPARIVALSPDGAARPISTSDAPLLALTAGDGLLAWAAGRPGSGTSVGVRAIEADPTLQ